MNEDILEIPVVAENGESIFSGSHYVVPIYQRAFSWGTGESVRHNEIIQLMNDVFECGTGSYRLGSLIVARRGIEKYEVIDGQQRLTALFLILSRLGIHLEQGCLSYACRPSAEVVLGGIAKDPFFVGDGVPENDPALGIVAGLHAIDQEIAKQENPEEYKKTLLKKFKQTVLYRVVVPENTDLNRYFEIMNTRGEQLEPQDIVKADLMKMLEDVEQSAFATIWDACSNMDGYCQMHFQDKNQRNLLFGSDWTELKPFDNGALLLKAIGNTVAGAEQAGEVRFSFHDLVFQKSGKLAEEGLDDQYSRFESIIDFRHFLLHALKVFSGGSEGTLNDLKLIDTFKDAAKNYKGTSAEFSRAFILHLLKCRYLFDKHVIKRVYDANGRSAWCLNEIVLYTDGDGGPSYRQTWKGNNGDNETILMLEACLRVSYLDPKSMHWVTRLLEYLVENNILSAEGIVGKLDEMAKEDVKTFLENGNYDLGVATPHIVFNYLDYLLWTRQDEIDEVFQTKGIAKGFAFEYRSSVEHWYPQTPPNGVEWTEVNRFGNLCILRGDINSKFSNLFPKSKQLNREQYIKLEHQSLKLRIMAKITELNDWDKGSCAEHEKMMLRVLRGESIGLTKFDEGGATYAPE